MRKIYSLVALSLLGISLTASAEFTFRSGLKFTKDHSNLQYKELTGVNLNKTATVDTRSAQNIEDEYIITIGDYYFEDSVGEITQEGTITRDGNVITISSDYFPTPVKGVLDETTGDLHLPKKTLVHNK